MLPYQEKYLQNVSEIASLCSFFGSTAPDFPHWYQEQKEAAARIETCRKENEQLLQQYLFPVLDELHSVPEETLADLDAFADQLLDWKNNLDCGVYVAIHEALLRIFRVRKERDRIIRELYKLGMGLYYLNRMVIGMENEKEAPFLFANEMVFTEAASYFRYYEKIDNEETRGYIIRAMANIALTTHVPKKKIAASAKALQIIDDENYRALASSLPWDAFRQKTHQQSAE